MEYLKLKLTPKEYDAIIEILESVQSAWVGSFDEELSKDAKRAIKAFNSAAKRSCTPGILGGNSYAQKTTAVGKIQRDTDKGNSLFKWLEP